MAGLNLTPLQSWSLTRKSIAAIVAVIVATASYRALIWVRKDITYWSRSVTFTYRTDTLEQCTRLVALDLPGVTVSTNGKEFALSVPNLEGVIVKPTSNAQEARLVVYGHSRSISTLGPESEEAVNDTLRQLSAEFARLCSSTTRGD